VGVGIRAVEALELTPGSASFWTGRRVLLTGHTGFKGSWLSLWLQALGAEVHGLALEPPTDPSLFEVASVAAQMSSSIGDIRTYATVLAAFQAARPEVVLHLAAQPLVRASYEDPLGTYATNVMGTAHVLEASRHVGTVRAIVNVTTDKVYENRRWLWGYREDEQLGGHDPYSSSKAASELVTSAYRRSFLAEQGIALGSARAGNVIGGGDWATDRLVPDVLRAFDRGEDVLIRNPSSVRPWQHVLEPLSGYLLLAQQLYLDGPRYAQAWNFGPFDTDARPVSWIVGQLADHWGIDGGWRADDGPQPHEAELLKLDISKADAELGWGPTWTLAQALEQIVSWHRAWRAGSDMREFSLQQIRQFTQHANGRT
jgi:CDP-glucose 4,6-dehydratase